MSIVSLTSMSMMASDNWPVSMSIIRKSPIQCQLSMTICTPKKSLSPSIVLLISAAGGKLGVSPGAGQVSGTAVKRRQLHVPRPRRFTVRQVQNQLIQSGLILWDSPSMGSYLYYARRKWGSNLGAKACTIEEGGLDIACAHPSQVASPAYQVGAHFKALDAVVQGAPLKSIFLPFKFPSSVVTHLEIIKAGIQSVGYI